MTYLVGTDEAGYGPNLGPLVISASVWEVEGGATDEDLYRRLDAVVTARPTRVSGEAAQPVAITDSKALYRSGKGLRLLERGLWAAWTLLDRQPATCGDVWNLLAGDCTRERHAALCGLSDDTPAPLDAEMAEAREALANLDASRVATPPPPK